MARPPARSDPDRYRRLRQGSARGRASRGNPAGRCGLDPAANEALARGRAHNGDDAHRDPGKARRQGCRLAGKGHGRAISQVISARTKGEGTMPHVIVKMHPGRSEQQKAELAEAIVKDVMAVAKVGEKAVSVAIEEVKSGDWADKVY